VDYDILLGSRLKNSTADLLKRANVHRLILDVVRERYPPTLIAIGPPNRENEPADHVAAAREMLHLLARFLSIPTITLDTDDISRVLKKHRRESLARAVERRLETPIGGDRWVVLATATALVGAELFSGKQKPAGQRKMQ